MPKAEQGSQPEQIPNRDRNFDPKSSTAIQPDLSFLFVEIFSE